MARPVFFWPPFSGGPGGAFRYAAGVSDQTLLKLLFELRAVLDRIGENDDSIEEAIVHDVDRAKQLADDCISQLTLGDSPVSMDAEVDEED